jgi:hypothetical protein
VVAAVSAATIVGTAKNDVLKGTKTADTIYGKAGNDRLFGYVGNDVLNGGPGNDVLVGGAGADRLLCGAGKDKATADAKDKVAKDCEQVTGLPQPSPPPPPPPAPPPPPPPAPAARAGHYCGFTNNGYGFCFDITAGGQGFTNAHFAIKTTCTPDSVFEIEFGTFGVTPIQPDLTFDFEIRSGEEAGSYFKGTLDTVGNAKGVVHIVSSFDYEGTHYNCLFDTEWTAKI